MLKFLYGFVVKLFNIEYIFISEHLEYNTHEATMLAITNTSLKANLREEWHGESMA